MFLDSAQLKQMTGYARGAEQARWFREHGYYVECNARGVPLITQLQIDERRRRADSSAETVQTSPRRTEPNVLAFQQKLNRHA